MLHTAYATTSDDLSIAYQLGGEGPPDLVWVPGFASHVESFWDLPGYAHAYRRLMRFSRLLLFDKRGTGLSDRALGTATLEDRVRDVEAVVEAAGMTSFALLGSSEGGAMAALFAASHPDRVSALIFIGADVTGDWIKPDMPGRIEVEWGSGTLMSQLWLNGAGDLEQLGRIERAMGTPKAMAEQMRRNTDLDARPVLEAITAPTLVLHCQRDPVVSITSGQYLAEHIRGAKLVKIDGAFHGSNRPEEMDRYVDEIEEFLTGSRAGTAAASRRVLATILLTDLVASTDHAVASGDERWTTLLAEHDRVARHAIARFEGRWIKSTGDGVLAVFPGPTRAISAARAMGRNLEPLGLRLRAGIHTGEIEERGDDVHGIAVNVTARINALAAPGEIWVSATVPGLTAGSGIEYEDRGSHRLKGVPGEWPLAAVKE